MEALGKLTAGLIGLFIAIVVAPVWSGVVLTKLWAWFIVPFFPLEQIGVVHAIGLSMLVGYLAKASLIDVAKSEEYLRKSTGQRMASALLLALLYPAFVLLFAWIVAQFLPAGG